MNRVFKFRAWDKKFQQMVEVSELRYSASLGTFYPCSLKGKADVWYNPFDDQCDLLMFTGLLDKNGKEIYEGDLLKVTAPHDEEDNTKIIKVQCLPGIGYTIEWNNGFCGGDADITTLGWANDEGYEFEVIGNIYQNPELLQL